MKKKIGQLFIVGYQGEEPSDDFLHFVEEWGIGGIIVFARNLDDPSKLPERLEKISSAAGQKIFTAIDQEGGLVLRILSNGSLFPSAMALSAINNEDIVEKCYEAIGLEMKSLGLNWNLAPVLDINHPDNPGIGARSFGDTPQTVAKFGCAAIRGLQKAGVLACAKHFPGKGQAKVDSHLTLPIIPFEKNRLEKIELFPFKKAIEQNVDAIMTSHVFFPAYESAPNLPATLSKSVLTNLLRTELKYNGLLITDDLEMGAITESYGIAQAANLSFHAGADLLLICHSIQHQKLAAETILKSVKGSNKSEQLLARSLARIAIARENISDNRQQFKITELQSKHLTLINDIYKSSIRLLGLDSEVFPVNDKKCPTLFCVPQISALVQVEEDYKSNSLKPLIEKEFPRSSVIVYNPKSSYEEILNQIYQKTGSNKLDCFQIIFMTYNAHLLSGQEHAINVIISQIQNIAIFALRNPYDLSLFKAVKTRGATFGFRTPAIKALLSILKGEIDPIFSPWPINISDW